MAQPAGIVPSFPTKEELLSLYNHEKDARLARRYLAMYLLAKGSDTREVASVINRSAKTVSRWADAFHSRGIGGLWPKKNPGRISRLTREQMKELDADLQKNPRDLGYDFSNWDGKTVMYHLQQKFHVLLKVRRVQIIMRALGLTLQRPKTRSERTSKPAEAAWKAEFQEKKKREFGPHDVLLFLNEASIKWVLTIYRMWAKKGHQPVLLAPPSRKGVHLAGVIEPATGRVLVEFVQRLKWADFQQFLQRVLGVFGGPWKVWIVLDNAPAHKAKALQPFLDSVKSQLELVFLPPYAPDLNMMERFWRFTRKKCTHNTYYATFMGFIGALEACFTKHFQPSEEIKTLCAI